MPTQTMQPEDGDYAVCFAVPANDTNLIYIYGRQSSDTRKLEKTQIDVGNINYGGQEAFIIFDNVFIPWSGLTTYMMKSQA